MNTCRNAALTGVIHISTVLCALVFAAGCAGKPPAQLRGTADDHVMANDTADSAFSRAMEFEVDGKFQKARSLYSDVKTFFGNQSVNREDVPEWTTKENYGAAVNHRLEVLSCKEKGERVFADPNELAHKTLEAIASGRVDAIAALLACETVKGMRGKIEPPELPEVQAKWLASQRLSNAANPNSFLPFHIAKQSHDPERILITVEGFRDYKSLSVDLRKAETGWVWWAIVGGFDGNKGTKK